MSLMFQILSLDWTETALNDTKVKLYRNLTVEFTRLNQNASNIPGYGVRRIFANIEVARFEDFDDETNATVEVSSFFDLDSGDLGTGDGVMFKVRYGHHS